MKTRHLASLFLCLCLLFTPVLASCQRDGNEGGGTKVGNAYVTVSHIPAVSLVLDSRGTVASVNGENNDGKLLLLGESVVGKSMDEAVMTLLRAERDMGYFATDASTPVTFSVSIESEALKTSAEGALQDSIKSALDALGVTATVEKETGKTREEMELYVKSFCPTLEDGALRNMRYKELLEEISTYQKGVAGLSVLELERFAALVKQNDMLLAEQQKIMALVGTLEGDYQAFLTNYAAAISALQEKVAATEQAYYSQFLAPDSPYREARVACATKRAELNAAGRRLAALPEGDAQRAAKEAAVAVAALLLSKEEAALDAARAIADAAFAVIEAQQASAINAVLAVREELPVSVEEILSAHEAEISGEIAKAGENSLSALTARYAALFEGEATLAQQNKATMKG